MKIESMLYCSIVFIYSAIEQTWWQGMFSLCSQCHITVVTRDQDKRSWGLTLQGIVASPSLPCWVVVAAVTIRAICFTLDILNYSHVRALLSGIVTCLPVNWERKTAAAHTDGVLLPSLTGICGRCDHPLDADCGVVDCFLLSVLLSIFLLTSWLNATFSKTQDSSSFTC